MSLVDIASFHKGRAQQGDHARDAEDICEAPQALPKCSDRFRPFNAIISKHLDSRNQA
jgi:hypothetical protein